MKKNLLLLSLFPLTLLSYAYAAPSLSHPLLQKASEQVNVRIDQKTSKIILDENSKKSINEKKERLSQILVAIDGALKNRDKTKLKEQAKLFRDGYKELTSFVGNLEKTNSLAGITGKNTDILYYADSFEGKKTANGNPFSQSFFSAAACEIPLNTLAQVGKSTASVIVKINDRPNCSKYPNLTDLTTAAFGSIGKLSSGKIQGTINTLGLVSKNYVKKTLPSDTFGNLGIALDAGAPNTYLKNETLHIVGKELFGKDFTILFLKSPSGKDITLGAKKGSDGRFEYNYPLEEIGTYQMVLASGLGFNTSTFTTITVLDDSLFSAKKLITVATTPEKLQKLNIERIELPDFTSLYLFHFPTQSFHTITIKSAQETFIYRGFGVIAIRGNTFGSQDINAPVLVEVESQESSTAFSHDTYARPVTIFSKTMTLTPGYKAEKGEDITVKEENGSLLIHGVVSKGKKVKSDIILTLPDGNVEKYAFDAGNIDTDGYMKRGEIFEKTLSLKQTGLYLVEVNYDNGFAAYNGPVAYGEILPIYPNDMDSVQKNISNADTSIVASESLKFVNSVRAKSSKSALSLDDTLSNLATIKANDMAKYQNLSHTDSSGDKINGTAKRNNINLAGGVGENIAGGNIYFKALLIGLANSGGHRANMLDAWKKIGVGYAVKDGQVYYVQVFGE